MYPQEEGPREPQRGCSRAVYGEVNVHGARGGTWQPWTAPLGAVFVGWLVRAVFSSQYIEQKV